ncbi:helix-turn-helix domain-containing protein [Nocardia sp. bgisy134]|uniref:PucR family transcriptional regulator n=1 Tax=Nocardia sp. bgisy134 TaxID=3413789 RepID=UPI003D706C7D
MWVPPDLAQRLRDQLGSVAAEVEDAVRAQVPEYAQAEHALGDKLRIGVVQALTLFVEYVAESRGQDQEIMAAYYELGWNAAREGRSLEAVQSALRVGGLHAWRLMGRTVEKVGLDSAVVSTLGELAFRTVHEVAEAASAGYAEARLRDSDELERRRRHLLDLLIGDSPTSPDVIRELAHSARWNIPEHVAVVVLAARDSDDIRENPTPTLLDALTDMDAHPPRLLLPDPNSGRISERALTLALRHRPAAIGPTVPLSEAANSLRWATRALRLTENGILPGGGILRCADHLSTLLLHSDQQLLRHLNARALAPISALPEAQRARLCETLLMWLLLGSNVAETAVRLNVHAQTVRYRLRQLEEQFGDALYDPQTRLELILALQAVPFPTASTVTG